MEFNQEREREMVAVVFVPPPITNGLLSMPMKTIVFVLQSETAYMMSMVFD